MRYFNRKTFAVILSGFVLISSTGCASKAEDSYVSSEEIVVETLLEENDSTVGDEQVERVTAKMDALEEEFQTYMEADSFDKVKDKAKECTFAVMDYILGYTSIDGVYFKDLPVLVKDKFFMLCAYMDGHLEEKIPGYKDTAKTKTGETYAFMRDKLHQGMDYIDSKLEEHFDINTGEVIEDVKDTFSDVKEYADSKLNDAIGKDTGDLYQEAKDEINDAWDTTKDVAKDGFSKFKSWYESKR